MASAFQSNAFQTDAFQSSTTVSASFTTDAFIQLYFRADAYIVSPTQPTFTADAVLLKPQTASFTADAFIRLYFTADAIKRKTQTASFTANAIKRRIVSTSLVADAYIRPSARQQHARTGPHFGTDTDVDHLLAAAFDRYLRGESLQEVLGDIDARLTAREGGRLSQRHLLLGNAIVKGTMSASIPLDAQIALSILASLTANAYVAHSFAADALLRVIQSASFLADAEIGALGFYADAFKSDPAVFISNSIAGAPDWNISSVRKGAVISTASLTHEAGDPSNWFVAQDKTGWAKFVVGSTTTVRLDTVGSQGNMQIVLFGPGSSPTNGNALEFNDDSVVDPTNPWGFSDRIDRSVAAGTYFVGVALYDFSDADATVQLNMETL